MPACFKGCCLIKLFAPIGPLKLRLEGSPGSRTTAERQQVCRELIRKPYRHLHLSYPQVLQNRLQNHPIQCDGEPKLCVSVVRDNQRTVRGRARGLFWVRNDFRSPKKEKGGSASKTFLGLRSEGPALPFHMCQLQPYFSVLALKMIPCVFAPYSTQHPINGPCMSRKPDP